MIPVPYYSYEAHRREVEHKKRIENQNRLHKAAVARRRKAKRGGKR